MTDPHRVLGVPEDATQEEITSAYHRLVRRYHPDSAENGAEADRFREVVAAYEVLRHQAPHEREQTEPAVRTQQAPWTEPARAQRAPWTEPAIRVGPVRYHGPPRGP